MVFLSPGVKAQKMDTIVIKTSAQCGMCEDRIEKALAYERGVKEFDLNLEDKKATVVFKTQKTSADKLRKAISDVGYDADDVSADPEAYKDLPACCKKPDDPDYEEMDG